MLRALWTVVAIPFVLPLPAGAAGATKRDVMGIVLGTTPAEIVKGAKVQCRVNKADGVSCVDPTDGSEYKVYLSGGSPSRALSVKHTFCSAAPAAAVLGGLLKSYGVTKSAAHKVPNGTAFDVTADVQGVLNTSDQPCADGRRSYQFMLSDAALLKMQP